MHAYFDYIFDTLRKEAEKSIADNGETTIENSINDLISELSEHKDIILNDGYADGLSDNDAEELLDNRRQDFERLSYQRLGKLYEYLDEKVKSDLLLLISNIFVRNRFILRSSGVVIAGYGTTEVFPRIVSYVVEGVFDGKVRKVLQPTKSNIQNDDFVTQIIPYAQDEMVWTFLTGIDPGIEKFSEEYLQEIFKKYPESINRHNISLGDEELKLLKSYLWKGGEQLFADFREALSSFQRKNNTQPILDMVRVLPKDELAAMAESLVNLTVFKRKISKSVETVGGPIDVAVISKGDGFIWVKRKHYFKPELNQHFFANYFK